MRKYYICLLLLIVLSACTTKVQDKKPSDTNLKVDTTDQTNDFYDNAKSYPLENTGKIKVAGEIMENTEVDFSSMPMRSVIVKETLLTNKEDSFVGAYQYHGYSLYDILNHVQVDKANKDEYRPIIDLYITIEGNDGETTVLSWGEIYYPANRHQILIATKVTPIVPSKTKDMWPIPGKAKLVVSSDLFTHRNLSEPDMISVHSLDVDYEVKRDMEKLYSPSVDLISESGEKFAAIKEISDNMRLHQYPTTFYGRGRGIHGITTFKGYLLKDLLAGYYQLSSELIQHGMFTVAASDGYRAAFTFSEIMNRNDQSETMVIDYGKDKGDGRFRLFHSADFFSDRAIKAVSEIRLDKPNETKGTYGE